MLTYWFLFLFTAMAALSSRFPARVNAKGMAPVTPGWIIFGILLTAIIGLRHEVGGDWYNYLGHLDAAYGEPLSWLVTQSDPGYRTLNWLSLQLGWDIYGVNTLAALVFSVGLIIFCRGQPRPWLAAAVAVPYLVIVVAMGYSRQGIALGFAMIGLMALERKSVARFAIWVLIGATFHRSAVLLLPIAALASTRNRMWIAFWIGVLGLVGYLALLEEDVEALYTNYIERGYQSQGALIRLLMNAIAASIYLAYQKRFSITPESRLLWRWISFLALLLLAAFFVAPSSSTALDRLGLYLLPLQLMVFAHLPSILGGQRRYKPWVFAILGYYALIQFVWLNYAANAYAWLPYKFYPLEP